MQDKEQKGFMLGSAQQSPGVSPAPPSLSGATPQQAPCVPESQLPHSQERGHGTGLAGCLKLEGGTSVTGWRSVGLPEVVEWNSGILCVVSVRKRILGK